MSGVAVVRGVLLDVDGTLLDSNSAHASAWCGALAEQGVVVSVDRLRRLIGMGADHLLPSLGLREDGVGKAAQARKNTLFRERYLPHLKPQRGARDLVLRFARAGMKRVVATSSSRDDLALLLRAAGIEDLIENEATADQADHSKPNPDIVRAAIERAGLPPRALVLLGDTPYDVAAATRAGVSAVCVRCGGWDDEALAGAAAVYDEPADLVTRFDESPFVRAK
jgi:HAD superfamily hydrolase (TIGR01509 family)